MPESDLQLVDHVGPLLEAGDPAQAIIRAIREQNGGVVVRERGSYIRVLAPRRCEVSRARIERILGHAFCLPGDLEAVMPSFKGTFIVTEDQAVWAFE